MGFKERGGPSTSCTFPRLAAPRACRRAERPLSALQLAYHIIELNTILKAKETELEVQRTR